MPALLSYAMRGEDMAEKHSAWMSKLQLRYRALLEYVESHRVKLISASVGLLVASVAYAPLLGSEFLPKLDEGNIWLTITLPPATGLEKTKEVEREVRAILRSYPEVNMVVSQVGRPDDGTDPKGPNNLELLAELKPREQWRVASKEALVTDMSARIRNIPGVPTNFSQVIQDNVEEALSGAKGEIVVKLFGPDLDILEEKSEKIVSILKSVKGSSDVAAFRIGGQTELTITIDREKIGRYALGVNDVNTLIQTALAGNAVSTFFDGDRIFDVTVRLQSRYRDAADDIADLQVPLPPGPNGLSPGTVALGDLSHIEIRQGATRIAREAGGRIVAVKANLIGRDQGSFVAEAQKRVNKEVHLPAGYRVTWGGQFENQQRSMARLKIVVLPLGAARRTGAVHGAVHPHRRHCRSGPGRAAFVGVGRGGLHCGGRHLGTERRDHGRADHGVRAQRPQPARERDGRRGAATAADTDDGADGRTGFAASSAVAWHRLGDAASVRSGDRRRHRLGHHFHSAVAAAAVSAVLGRAPDGSAPRPARII